MISSIQKQNKEMGKGVLITHPVSRGNSIIKVKGTLLITFLRICTTKLGPLCKDHCKIIKDSQGSTVFEDTAEGQNKGFC